MSSGGQVSGHGSGYTLMAQAQLVRTVLGGHLGRRFPATWDLHLSNPSPAEAIRAIDVNLKGELRRELAKDGTKQFYKIAIGHEDNALAKDELANPSGVQTIYLLPVIKGRESGGGKILAGIAIIASLFIPGAQAFLGPAFTTVFASAGASLILGGITQLLTPTPSFNQSNETDEARSNVFEGNAASISQGGAVPLVYGRALVSPMPISISFTAIDQAIVNSFAPTEYDTVVGPGGVISYVPRAPTPEENLPEA